MSEGVSELVSEGGRDARVYRGRVGREKRMEDGEEGGGKGGERSLFVWISQSRTNTPHTSTTMPNTELRSEVINLPPHDASVQTRKSESPYKVISTTYKTDTTNLIALNLHNPPPPPPLPLSLPHVTYFQIEMEC